MSGDDSIITYKFKITIFLDIRKNNEVKTLKENQMSVTSNYESKTFKYLDDQ